MRRAKRWGQAAFAAGEAVLALLVSNVAWVGEDVDPRPALAKILGVPVRAVTLVKKSLDARHHDPNWRAVYRVEVDDDASVLAKRIPAVRAWNTRDDGRYGLADGTPRSRWRRPGRPIVVGLGPAGMFAAMYLAEAGAPVLVLERGGAVEGRVEAVNGFWRRQRGLDPESNLVFGEGGAGTFSDGKIYTRRRDGEIGYILRRFVEFGADPGILQDAWAHVGTDRIRALLPPFRARLTELGAEVRFNAKVVDLVVEGGECVGVVLADGTMERGSPVLVGTGHSARDAVEMMVRAGAAAEPRGIAVGARIEHPQTVIDLARYGQERSELPPASYRLAYNPKQGPAAHTFCMCPGGMVVPASNHPDRVVVNGMSFAARRGFFANAAVIVDVPVEAYGATDPLAGFRWQDAIEARAFTVGGGNYAAPAQRVSDLLARRASTEIGKTSFPMGVVPLDLREVLPEFLVAGMARAIRWFDREIPGFGGEEGVLIAPETRTTSPIRFARDESQQSTSVKELFPIGEGAGYAGGIVSSALDGLRAAQALVDA